MLTDKRLAEIRALLTATRTHDAWQRVNDLEEAGDELLAEIDRLRDQLRARRSEDDTKEVPV